MYEVHFRCGHIVGGIKDLSAAVCPTCANYKILLVKFVCQSCGEKCQKTYNGRLKYPHCNDCQKYYNGWNCARRKAELKGRIFASFDVWLKRRKSQELQKTYEPPLEPPLTLDEVKELSKFGAHRSPCAKCKHIMRDKNGAPCFGCAKVAEYNNSEGEIYVQRIQI